MENVTLNYPEMDGDTEDLIQVQTSIIGGFIVKSKEPIQIKRGITFDGIIEQLGSSLIPNKRAGWYRYHMTNNAYNTFVKTNKVTLNCLL